MPDRPADLYAALCARDRRFDGRFYVGVSTTGIYCRPVCAVRTPRFEHCSFFANPAAAEAQGYRPCLRCRPELAPGLSPIDAADRYARAAARLIEQGFLSEHDCAALARRLGITDRHLRRVFAAQFGTSPVEYAQTQRLLFAKRLLAESDLPVTEIALAAGFGSLRRFNALVQARYGLTPSAMRSRPTAVAQGAHGLRLRLAYRPPFDWPGMLAWFAHRAIPGVETVHGPCYLRSVSLLHGGQPLHGWIRVTADAARHGLLVEPSPTLLPALPMLLARLRRLFDLDAAPADIAAVLGALAAAQPGLRLPGALSGFEGAARAVLEQQVSTRAAASLLGRFAQRFGSAQHTPFAGVERLFPDPQRVAEATPEDIAAIGIPRTRANALRQLAIEATAGRLDLEEVVDIEQGLERLRELPGIGPWTAGYIAMRAWSWPDIFLATDYVVRKRLPDLAPRAIEAHAARWAPWRSYAVMHLWSSQAVAPPTSPHAGAPT